MTNKKSPQKNRIHVHLILTVNLIAFFVGCARVEYVIKGDFIYKNSTNHMIEVVDEFVLKPRKSHLIEVRGEGPKEVTPESYRYTVPQILRVVYNNIRCDTLYMEVNKHVKGNTRTRYYQVEKLAERYYKFTYVFTEADYQKAVVCGEIKRATKATFVYINHTRHTIEIVGSSVSLGPGKARAIIRSGTAATASEEVTYKNYTLPFDIKNIVRYDGTKCDTLASEKSGKGEGILGFENYQHEKRGDREYKFTYVFTETDYRKAMPCK